MKAVELQPIRSRKKVEAAQKALKALALSLGANNKMPTVREICKQLNISAVTAESVLSGLEDQCVVIRRQGSGIYVSPRLYQKNVGLVFGRYAFQPGTSPFCAMMVEACQRRAQSHNENFSFYLDVPRAEYVDEDRPVHTDLIDALSKGRLGGMMLVARHSEPQEAWLRAQGVPVVTFTGGVLSPYKPCTVGFDLKEMATLGIAELVARGCRRVAMIAPYDAAGEIFPLALSSAGLPFDSARFVNACKSAPPSESRTQTGQRVAKQMLAAADRPDGLILMDDMLATGAIAAAQELSLTVGRDILVASHANRGSTTLMSHREQLILVEVSPDIIVETMFGMLGGMMDQRSEPGGIAVPSKVQIGSLVRPVA